MVSSLLIADGLRYEPFCPLAFEKSATTNKPTPAKSAIFDAIMPYFTPLRRVFFSRLKKTLPSDLGRFLAEVFTALRLLVTTEVLRILIS